MHNDAIHHSLALIDHLAPLLPRIQPHDARLAHALRTTATAIPQLIAAGQAERLARAHTAAARVHVMLHVAQAWGYVHTADIAEAQLTARHVHTLTTP